MLSLRNVYPILRAAPMSCSTFFSNRRTCVSAFSADGLVIDDFFEI
jgi:hypothetical protein